MPSSITRRGSSPTIACRSTGRSAACTSSLLIFRRARFASASRSAAQQPTDDKKFDNRIIERHLRAVLPSADCPTPEVLQREVTESDALYNDAATADKTVCREGTCHYLRQIGPRGSEAVAVYGDRLETNRGNGYLADGVLNANAAQGIFPNFDCKNTDYAAFFGAHVSDLHHLLTAFFR